MTMQSSTSQGSLPEEVGPTGQTDAASPSSFWGAVLKRASSPDSSATQQNNQGNSSVSSPKPSSSPNVLSWLAGLGSTSPKATRHSAHATVPEHEQPAAAARQHLPVNSTGGSGRSGEDAAVQATGWDDKSTREKPRARRPSTNNGTYVSSANLPDVSATPDTPEVVRQAQQRRREEEEEQQRQRKAEEQVERLRLQQQQEEEEQQQKQKQADEEAEAVRRKQQLEPSAEEAAAGRSRRSSSDGGSELPAISCTECGECIQGAVFMLHDQPYCCQRHRLAAYHKMEKEGQRGILPAPSAAASTAAAPAVVQTGLRASYASWL